VGVIGVAVFPERARPPKPIWRPRRSYSYDERYVPEPSAARESEYGSGQAAPAPKAAQAPRAGASRAAPPADGYRDYDDATRKRKGRAGPGGPSNIGTEYGENEDSSVVEVAFERRSPTHPAALLTVRYDDFDGLEARGIDLSSLGYAYHYEGDPEPFPYSRFAQPPR
jgi:hypothetical protein